MNWNRIEFETSFGEYTQLPPPERLEIAFSGRSNVGKSSLINKIAGRKNLARVSSSPGKTATINFYKAEDMYLVDLPGYGYAKVSKSDKERWQRLIGGYLSGERDIGLLLQLVDYRHPPTDDDINMINALIDGGIPFAVIFTKADKLSKSERAKRMEGFAEEIPCFEDIKYVEFSAVTGEGTEEIRSMICELAEE